jgi:cytidyltransferase-like protein
MPKKVFVSGCFDMLHSGHVAFFEEASRYGDLYVAIGSDRNVFELKRRPTVNNEAERLYMIQSLACVKEVFVAKGSGILDFVQELRDLRPDYFVVNEDGSTPEKQKLCQDLGIEYVVLKRVPHGELAPRSTTALRGASQIPESLTLAGGWLEHPAISRLAPGSALTLSIHPLPATSSALRSAALELWNARLPADRPEKLARMLFGYANLPGAKVRHGSSAALGLTCPGLTRADYAGKTWPARISSLQDETVLKFIEDSLYFLPFDPQPRSLPGIHITPAAAQAHARAAEACWQALIERDLPALGRSLLESLEARAPRLRADQQNLIDRTRQRAAGFDLCELGSQAGLLLVCDKPIENAVRLSIRRASD